MLDTDTELPATEHRHACTAAAQSYTLYQPGTSASACIARASSVLVAALNVVKSGAPHVGRARDILRDHASTQSACVRKL